MKLDGKVLGIPFDFNPSALRSMRERWWNSDESRIFVPKTLGLGYDLNLYQLRRQKPLLFKLLVAGAVTVALVHLLGVDGGRENSDEDQVKK